jgi:hypothetical protein
MVDAQHYETLRLHFQPILKLTCVLSRLVGGVDCSLTLRLCERNAKPNKVGYMGRNSGTSIGV